MNDFSRNIILQTAPVLDALKQMNSIPGTLTLFVVDEKQQLVGTLTDGDIRRGFIKGLLLTDSVNKFMLTSFHRVNKGFSILDFKKARDKGIRLLPLLNDAGQIVKVYDLKKRKSILPLECMIMAGGRGERLLPLTDKTPKPMLPLGNKPIIEHNIDRLISFGIEKFYISVKYLGQQIVDYFGDGSAKGIQIEYVWEDVPLGTAGALSLVNRFDTEHILLMNSDLFTDADFEDLFINTMKHQAAAGVASVPYTTKVPLGIFTTINEQITGLKEKPVYTDYANAGIYILNTSVLNKIPRNTHYNITDLLEQLILDGQKVIHNPIVGYWIDIGQHQDYKNAQEIVKHLKDGN
ncbi:MAG: nucleotidyltransferase [Bacteroidetes bacterium GWF2_43_63]|nr:MAG: nucleotidyltransferase [Bacteroidetes bacterium GWE2_42_42]OFY56048.1 MAG: nucleotidyltransferase [Bacteroidetes bacterium GWF2_43_63]HBG70704.1 nucleotidyltransferase [Bacteroidales bacterium]HCB62468.1 nucleotidyltransferase [Bacteroidales bacterium]HCY21923.1 nucleotidyltransferase [Bacteroidales bacterium]